MVCWRLKNNPIRIHHLCYTSATKLSSIFSTYLKNCKVNEKSLSWLLNAIGGGGGEEREFDQVDHNQFIDNPHPLFDETSDTVPLHDLQSSLQRSSPGLQWPKEASWLSVAWAFNKPRDPPPLGARASYVLNVSSQLKVSPPFLCSSQTSYTTYILWHSVATCSQTTSRPWKKKQAWFAANLCKQKDHWRPKRNGIKAPPLANQ